MAIQESQDEQAFQDLTLEEIQKQIALEELYFKRAKTRQMRAEAAKSEAVARLYEMKADTFDKNFRNPPQN